MYGTPDALVRLGDQELRPARLVLETGRRTSIGRLEAEFDRGPGHVSLGDPLTLELGWVDGGRRLVFSGRVREIGPGRTIRIVALDRCRDLMDTPLRQAFRNCTLQEVATWCLERAGCDDFTLGTRRLGHRHHFLVCGEPALAALLRARETWRCDWDLYADSEGVVWFLPWEESPRAVADPPLFEYGTNLLELTPSLVGPATAETWLAPGLVHSQRVRLQDDRLWHNEVEARIERVVHRIDGDGGRTRFEWVLLPKR